MKRKKIAIIGIVGLPANYGGFETLAEYLTKELATEFEMTVFCSSKGVEAKPSTYNGAHLTYIPLQANGMQSILYDIIAIFKALFFADTLLILGVSGCMVLPFVRLFSRKKLVVNIDGLEWKRQKWGKLAKLFLKFSEKIAVNYAHVVISDNKVIQNYVLTEYNVKSELIAYGADHCSPSKLADEVLLQFPFLSNRYAFKVCRIEPENNIALILEAFSEVPTRPIVLIGNWKNSAYGIQLKARFSGFKNIHLLDPIYDQQLLNQLRSSCFIYVHGHSAGGTNPSLVEAMYLQLPILAYGVPYNRETTQQKALYFTTKNELKDVLMNLENVDLQALAHRMKEIADKNYTWSIIASQYAILL